MNQFAKQYLHNDTETETNDDMGWRLSVIYSASHKIKYQINIILLITSFGIRVAITKFVFLHFQSKLFLKLGSCKSYANIIAGCWKQIFDERKLLTINFNDF